MQRSIQARFCTRKIFILIVVACVLAVLFYFFPLFRVVPLGDARRQSAAETFNPAAFVDKFWNERLLPSRNKAVGAAELLSEIKRDRKAARRKYGRCVGLSDVYYYFVAGDGYVVGVDKNGVAISLKEGSAQPDFILQSGNIFGNAVRDGTGLLDVNDFPNSREFNDISTEINRRIEQQVLPNLLSKAAPGAHLRFAGCIEIADERTDLGLPRIIPFVAEPP